MSNGAKRLAGRVTRGQEVFVQVFVQDLLEAATRDPDAVVQQRAVYGLSNIGGQSETSAIVRIAASVLAVLYFSR